MATATKEKKQSNKPAAKALPAALASTDSKGTATPPEFSAANIAGHKACEQYVSNQTGIENAEKALHAAKEKATTARSVILAAFSQLSQPDMDAYIAGATRYRDGLIKSAPGPIKQAGDFIGYLKRVQFNLTMPDSKFTPTSMTELLTGKGTLPEKMQQLKNRINRSKPEPKKPDAKPDPMASAPVVKHPQKHAQAAQLSDRDISDFFDKVQKGQLGIVLYNLMARAKECGEDTMCEVLQVAVNKLNASE